MQFNYLGGQGSQRDTLGAALNQRSPVLDAALDFNKSAFVTGVQGAGQTMRTAMSLDQQQKESLLRNKTALQEGAMNRTSAMETLERRLSFDTEQTKAAVNQRKIETDAATRQRKIETNADVERRNKESDDKFRRDQAEFNRRLAEEGKAKDKPRADAKDDIASAVSGTLEGIKSQFGADLEASVFGDEGNYNSFNDDGTLKLNEDGTPVTQTNYSPSRSKIQSHFDRIIEQANKIADPIARRAFIERMNASGHLNVTQVRGMYDPVFKQEEAKRKAEERMASSGVTGPIVSGLRSEAK